MVIHSIKKGMGSILPTCLLAAFMHEDSKSVKFKSSHQYIFVPLGSTRVKALQKMLMKLTPYHFDWKGSVKTNRY